LPQVKLTLRPISLSPTFRSSNFSRNKNPSIFLAEDYKVQAVKALDVEEIQDGQKMDKKGVTSNG
jgi:hypothetical protein